MPPKRNLKAFLRKEIKKGRIEAPPPPPAVPKQDLNKQPLSLPGIKSFKKPGPSSLFGDTITTNSDNNDNNSHGSRVKSQTNAADKDKDTSPTLHLRRFPISRGTNTPSTQCKTSKNPELDAFRKELEDVVTQEAAAGRHEKRTIRKEKAALIQKIRSLEAVARQANVKKIKQPFNEPISRLPDPVTPEEKKNLMRRAELIEQARTNQHVYIIHPLSQPYLSILTSNQTPSSKRRRDNFDEDLLDGEDRMRLGLKRSRGEKATGHWRTTLNDYMPESQVDTEMFNKVNSLTPEEKMADRVLLNEYRRNAAIVDRFDKRMERKLQDMKRAKRK
ncbi:hypothetical protein BDZ45DRAFT_686182 [Acephala macrosclerotiorum]|nr:hypothetical protein BDZ45DRAFT_686182 [Acephala macrosclerotiorum]